MISTLAPLRMATSTKTCSPGSSQSPLPLKSTQPLMTAEPGTLAVTVTLTGVPTTLVAALYAHPELLAWNRRSFADYFEVVLDASIDLVRQRDPKGLYARVAGMERPEVVGIDIPWHAPQSADLVVDMAVEGAPEETAHTIHDRLVPMLARLPVPGREPADA